MRYFYMDIIKNAYNLSFENVHLFFLYCILFCLLYFFIFRIFIYMLFNYFILLDIFYFTFKINVV